jgi:3-hydroxyisobutyrate dehydrogenase-like beta-hydroxyacid dehydrogenase
MNESLKGWKTGFIGIGLMGKPMCLNLHRAGAEMIIYNRSHDAAGALQQSGISAVDSAAEVASRADIIIIMVADTLAVEEVLFADQGVASSIKPGALVIDMGTTAVSATREFAKRLQLQGCDFIDAPVSGGEIGAINGELSIMAGGTARAMHRAKPVFDVLGKSALHIGEVGTGQITKAANQIIVGLNIGAVAEALTLAKRAGADLNRVREALLGGFAASRILEVHGQRMIDESYKPGGKVTTQHKDLSQAIDLAAEFGLELPATQLNRQLYSELIQAGKGGLDHSALMLAIDTTKDNN